MATTSVKLKNWDRLLKKLERLEKKTARTVLRKALRKGAKIVQREAQRRVRVRSGLARSAIKVRAAKRMKRGTVGITVQTADGDYKGETFYAAFLEYGHHVGKRGLPDRQFVPPMPFMAPAAEATKNVVAHTVEAEVSAGIERLAKQ